MKWVNHILIAGSVTAVWKPELVPLAMAGSTAPDWLEWVPQKFGRRPPKHRTTTHYVASWALGLLFALAVWDWHHALAAFCAGGLSHVIADAFTVQGVPLGWWSHHRFTLLGGRFRTGQPGEYVFAVAVLAVCIGVSALTRHWGGGYSPYFTDWAQLYRDGIIDAKEWRENRFRWF